MARRRQVPVEDNMLLDDTDLGAAFLDDGFAEIESMELEYGDTNISSQTPNAGDSKENLASANDQNAPVIEEIEVDTVIEEELDAQLPVDLFETEDRIILKARVAGVKKGDLDIAIDGGKVTIRGVLNSADSEDIVQYHLQECYWGKFYRDVELPVPVKENDESIDATLDEGVLTLTFIKDKVETAKKIQIS